MDNKSGTEILENSTLWNVHVSLFKSSQWILRNFATKTEDEIFDYNDLDGITNKISALYTIASTNHMFELDPNYSTEENESKNNNKMCGVWINFYLKQIQNPYYELLEKYIKTLSEEKKDTDWNENDRVFKSCSGCGDKYYCLDLLKSTISSTFRKKAVSNQDISSLNMLFKAQIYDIMKFLKKLVIKDEKGNYLGFPHTIKHRKEVSAYNSIIILKFLLDFKEFVRNKNFDIDKFQKNIITTVENLQHADDMEVDRELLDKIRIIGCWDEYLFGKKVIRMKSTSNIASALLNFNCDEKIIKRTGKFFGYAFKDSFGNYRDYILDITDARDKKLSPITDISGTIAAVKFYLNAMEILELMPTKEEITEPLDWIIEQQNDDGSFPVLSKSLLEKNKNAEYINDKLKVESSRTKYNISLSNTVDAMSLLSLFLKKYYEIEKVV